MTWNMTTAQRKSTRADRALRRLSGRRWPYHLTCKGRRAAKWTRVHLRSLGVAMHHLTWADFDAASKRILAEHA